MNELKELVRCLLQALSTGFISGSTAIEHAADCQCCIDVEILSEYEEKRQESQSQSSKTEFRSEISKEKGVKRSLMGVKSSAFR